MGVYDLRPRVADLVFHLYDRPLHPELFDTLALRTVKRDDYTLTVRITRTGHAITWQTKTAHLTEVTARADWPLPERRARLKHRIRGEHCDTLPCGPAICYQTSFQVELLPQEIFFHVHDDIVQEFLRRIRQGIDSRLNNLIEFTAGHAFHGRHARKAAADCQLVAGEW